MNPKAKNIIDILNILADKLQKPLRIVETGTIRSIEPGYGEGDGHSTFYIAEWVKEHPESAFYSVDLDTNVCYNYLKEKGLNQYVFLCKMHSLNYFTNALLDYDFVYLDSDNDPELILNEFKLVYPKITDGGYVMVDDCSLVEAHLNKGDLLIPYLVENNIQFTEFDTHQILIGK